MVLTGVRRSAALSRRLLAVGFVVAWVTLGLYVFRATVLDPAFSGDVASAVLRTDYVEQHFADSLVGQLEVDVGVVDTTTATDAARDAVGDPRFERAFADAVENVHAQLLGEEPVGPVTLDPTGVTESFRGALDQVDPELAARLPPGTDFVLDIGGRSLPQVGGMRGAVDVLVTLGVLGATALVLLGILADPDRPRAMGRAGRRMLVLAALPLLVTVVLPLVLRAAPGPAEIGAAVLDGVALRLLPPALGLALLGALLWFASFLWRQSGPGSLGSPDREPLVTGVDDTEPGVPPVIVEDLSERRRRGRGPIG